MTLFFETAHQVWSFLGAVPAGFLVALCLDAGRNEGIIRMALDLLLLSVLGLGTVVMISLFRDQSLRLYHLLGMLLGAILYLQGLCRLKSYLVRVIKQKRLRKRNIEEGIDHSKNEMNTIR